MVRSFLIILGSLIVAAATWGCTSETPRDSQQAATAAPATPRGDPIYSWWVTARFAPTMKEIETIPVQRIHPDWSKALRLTREVLPPEAADDPPSLADSDFGFEREGDFNRDGKKDRALVGVYETRTGEKGRFLLILTERASGHWEKAFLETVSGEAGFSVLSGSDNQLFWSFCMDCDTWDELVWTGTGYRIETYSCCDQDPED